MTPTVRLHYDEPLLLSFDASVAGHGTWQGSPTIVLDRSAFYPESGGQLGDRGRIESVVVVDVQVDAQGVVHHRVESAAPLKELIAREVLSGAA